MNSTPVEKGSIVIIRNGFEQLLYDIQDLKETNELSIGHLFTAVRFHFRKNSKDYGTKWINFRTPDHEISKAFLFMKKEIEKLPNDYEKLQKVLSHLGETLE